MTPLQRVLVTIPAAFLLWFLTFAVHRGNFWLKLSCSALLLALLALKSLLKREEKLFHVRVRFVVVGILSAVLLYAIFWLGREISTALFPFASREIGNVYVTKAELNPAAIGLLLFFIMGPAEEIYWRGFVQKTLSRRLGRTTGLLITSAVYALIHIFAFNFMLFVAAAVCGLFWGLLYLREGSLVPVMLSHALWDLMTFVLFPFN
ncbi:MAG TPA: CPBP family intramembrane glutamic endopeptidase [Syntrophorhabdales bacterium]|nr:CPBP family intramembrane glutamic endopeptidase [Syntrophorhabdales bacterium]